MVLNINRSYISNIQIKFEFKFQNSLKKKNKFTKFPKG